MLDIALAVVGLAGFALFAREQIASVVFFLAFGLALAVVWGRLGAPDVALAEAAIGAGLTGALLLDATRRPPPRPHPQEPRPRRYAAVLVAFALDVPVAVLLVAATQSLGRSLGLGEAVPAALPGTGVSHPVTAVLLDLRSYDTLLEVAVLLVAALAALALHHGGDLDDTPFPRPPSRCSADHRRAARKGLDHHESEGLGPLDRVHERHGVAQVAVPQAGADLSEVADLEP